MFPFSEFIENPEKIDTTGHVPPAEDRRVPHLQSLRRQLWLFSDDTTGIVQEGDVVLAPDVGHDVLVEELQHQGDAVGKHQVLGHELKLVNVIDLEMFEKEQQDG